jgi:hypothetical protein
MDWTSQQDEEFRKNYKELKAVVDEALLKARKAVSPRDAKGFLISAQDSFKGKRLQREQREELYGRLQDAFGEVNRKIEEEKSKFENEAQKNYATFRILVEEAQFLASHPRDFHETWEHLVDIQSRFREAKFMREHREELYSGLQHAFDTLKKKRSAEQSEELSASAGNYANLLETAEELTARATVEPDIRLFKDELIRFQTLVRESKLVKDHRHELLEKIQEAFLILTRRQDDENLRMTEKSESNYTGFLPRAKDLSLLAESSGNFYFVRESIKLLQSEIREASLVREQRVELNSFLQEAFQKLGKRQDKDQESFLKSAAENYIHLKGLVEKGLRQAEESNKYKETREFLKKIQSGFKNLKLVREEREELYSILQTAFGILNRRVDEYFRLKKKNWMLKMEYRFTESSSEIFRIQESLEKDLTRLKELEDQLEIVLFAKKEKVIADGLRSRIESLHKTIDRKHEEIRQLEQKMNELHDLLEPGEETA